MFHDWDKFLLDEFVPYAKCFYKPNGEKQYDEKHLAVAWNLHQKRNKHHWQFWLITWDRGQTEALPMPDVYRREMLADWVGAGRVLGKPNTRSWYLLNRNNIILHSETRIWIEKMLGVNHAA